ncbi:hypothetical protein QYM36_009817, partial [Artemia franciscana]
AILFKAYGFEEEQKIQFAVGTDDDCLRMFSEALDDCYTTAKGHTYIRSQKEALQFLIDTLHSHGFCSSYAEVQKFKRCASVHDESSLAGVTSAHAVQHVADNADRDAAAKYHSLRVYCQVQISLGNPVDPLRLGWKLQDNEVFAPIKTDLPAAPSQLLKIIKCSCRIDGCDSEKCTCSKIKTSGIQGKSDEERGLEACRMILSHIPAENDNFHARAIYLGMMVRRIIKAQLDPSFIDDRDYIGNKRVELAGSLIALVFEDLFKRLCQDIAMHAEKVSGATMATSFDVSEFITKQTVSQGLIFAIGTGNWIIGRFGMHRKGVSQVLSRFSYISMLGMLTRVNSQFEKTRKVGGVRSLVGSQWGVLCPSDTPEGEGCGLVKNLALLAHITTPSDDKEHRSLVKSLGAEDIQCVDLSKLGKTYMVLVNGSLVAATDKPAALVRAIRHLRRKGYGSPFVSVYLENRHRCVYIATDGGRLCRPYIIVENGKPKVTTQHIQDLSNGKITFQDFVDGGLVEYLDVNEENLSLVAVSEFEVTPSHTHMEIEPYTILGVVAGLIPFPHHNQSPRNTYQCAMGKQAMGVIGLNQRMRIDSLQYNIVYPMKPMVKSRTIDLINFEQLPAGQNAIVAVMSYSGYDIEDAIVLNQASVDRGYGRCIVYKNEVIQLRSYDKGLCDKIDGPLVDKVTREPDRRHVILGKDGIVEPGSRIQQGNVLVNKKVPLASSLNLSLSEAHLARYQDVPVSSFFNSIFTSVVLCRYKHDVESFAEQVLLSSNKESSMLVKISLRQVRRPELGDKFSSRHGQKGVTAIIVPQENMPFSCYGVVPDMIMNPHGFPSRMTVAKLIELLAGKAGLLDGKQHYGTCFGGSKVKDVSDDLIRHGYNYLGKEVLTCGLTGEPLTGYIYFGPVYYQKLKHMVQDKMHARSSGPVKPLTRQPVEGRAKEGGLRVGEMERDCLIAYGST